MNLDTGGFPAAGSPLLKSPIDGSATLLAPPIGSNSTLGLALLNPNAAGLGLQQFSQYMYWGGYGFATTSSTSQLCEWKAELQPVQGTANPSAGLVFSSQINGAGYNQKFRLDSTGGGSGPAIASAYGNGAGNIPLFSAFFEPTGATEQVRIDSFGNINLTGTLTGGTAAGVGTNFVIGTGGVTVKSTGLFAFATTTPNGAADVFLSRSGAAVLQQGAANAASPLAQTLQAQGSRAGTDVNVSGANYTHSSGQGTGNAAGSSLIFQTPVAVASGSGAQTMTTALTINGTTATFTNAATFSALTATRIPFSGTAGLQTDSANLVWDNATASLNLGGATPGATSPVRMAKSTNTDYGVVVNNTSNGTVANSNVVLLNDASASVGLYKLSSGYTTNGLLVASQALVYNSNGNSLFANIAASPHIFSVGGVTAANEIVRFDATTGVTIKSGVKLQLGNAAVTGLTAGVLAATTNATLVLYDSGGQAYRVPCII